MSPRVAVHRAACAVFAVASAGAIPLSWLVEGEASLSHVGDVVLAQYAVMTVAMLAAWRTTPREPRLRDIGALIVAGVLARALVFFADPYLSNDMERYLWDGRLAYEGFDPYRVAPDDPVVRNLRDTWPTPEEHAQYPTLYPPAALGSFALAASTGLDFSSIAWRALTSAAGLAILFVSHWTLRRFGALRHHAIVSLSPLLVLEVGVGAHVDVFSTLGVALALLALSHARPVHAAAALGIGALFKLLPAVALVPLVMTQPGRRAIAVAACGGLIIVGGYASAFGLGLEPLGSTLVFLEKWRFGSPGFALIERALHPDALLPLIFTTALLGLAFTSWPTRRADWVHRIQLALAIPLLLSPVVFPWYLCVLVPGLALAPNALVLTWISLHPLTYEVLNGYIESGHWSPAGWPLLVIAIGVGIAAVFDARADSFGSAAPVSDWIGAKRRRRN